MINKELIRYFLNFSFIEILNKFSVVIIQLALAKIFVPEVFGKLSVYIWIINLLSNIGSLGYTNIFPRYYFSFSQQYRNRFYSYVLYKLRKNSLIVTLISLFFIVISYLFTDTEDFRLYCLSIIVGVLVMFNHSVTTLMTIEHKFNLLKIRSLIKLVSLISICYIISLIKLNEATYILSILASEFVVLLYSLKLINFGNVKAKILWDRHIFSFSKPFFINTFCNSFNRGVDKLFTLSFFPKDILGSLGLSGQVLSMSTMFTSIVSNSSQREILKKLKKQGINGVINTTVNLSVLIYTSFSIGVFLFNQFMSPFISNYYNKYALLSVFFNTMFFRGIIQSTQAMYSNIFSSSYRVHKKRSITNITALLINLIITTYAIYIKNFVLIAASNGFATMIILTYLISILKISYYQKVKLLVLPTLTIVIYSMYMLRVL